MYLRKYNISTVAFLENTSQQLPLYIIWFRVSPNENTTLCQTYLKPSQTSKMKLLEKVVNASRDIFRTVFSIQNSIQYSEHIQNIQDGAFYKNNVRLKAVNFSVKSSIVDILLGPENASGFAVFNYFHQNCILDL